MPSAELRHPEEAQSAVSKDAAGVRSQIWSCAVLAGDEGVPALAAQFAGRAGGTAIAPIVPVRAVAFIAAMGLVANQLDERIAAQFTRQRPCRRLVADPAEHAEIDEMIDAELFVPFGKVAAQAPLDRLPAVELDPVPLPIVEADRLDPGEPRERPGKAGRRILPAGKQDKRRFGLRKLAHAREIGLPRPAINKPTATRGRG